MVTSPVRGCGKTTLLDLLEAMCVRPLKSDSITAASIYHAVDREHPTLLIDEADNLGLAFNGALRAVLNSGHRRGGKVTRYHGGQARSFATFAPVAVAAIGTLPLPVMHRFTCPQSPESANCRRGTKPNALSRPGQSTLRAIWAKHACCCSQGGWLNSHALPRGVDFLAHHHLAR
jgi:hypothetical protein